MEMLGRDFYLRDTEMVAKELLGKLLVRRVDGWELALEITETEAYIGTDDPACHAYRGRLTDRTRVMYGPGGFAYIYFVYGMHHMLNAVTREEGNPQAVLIRAGLPLEGSDAMSLRRFGLPWEVLPPAKRRALSNGPGKLCATLGLTRKQNGLDLTGSELVICHGKPSPFAVETGPRIGIDYAGEAAGWPLNFRLVRKN